MSTIRIQTAKTAVTIFTKNNFTNLKQTGEGGEACVYTADHVIHGKVSIKVFSNPSIKNSVQEWETLVKLICHQNIVRFLGLFDSDEGPNSMRCGYVMEHMTHGSLSTVIHNLSIKYNEQQVYSWIKQAGRGIAYLHGQHILHRDINPRNMLLGESIDVLKISDFGMARQNAPVDGRMTYGVGTVTYMAPEVAKERRGEIYNSAADIYSLGISVWEMFHRKQPFYELKHLATFELSQKICDGARPRIELGLEDEMKDLLLRSFKINPAYRPNVKDFIAVAGKLVHISSKEFSQRNPEEQSHGAPSQGNSRGSSTVGSSKRGTDKRSQRPTSLNRSMQDIFSDGEPLDGFSSGQMLSKLRKDDYFRPSINNLCGTLDRVSLDRKEEQQKFGTVLSRLDGVRKEFKNITQNRNIPSGNDDDFSFFEGDEDEEDADFGEQRYEGISNYMNLLVQRGQQQRVRAAQLVQQVCQPSQLLAGWETRQDMQMNGRNNFVDHFNKTTTNMCQPSQLLDGWKMRQDMQMNGRNNFVDHFNKTTTNMCQPSQLLDGWKMRQDMQMNGRNNFVNHFNNTTTWTHHKKISHMARNGALTFAEDNPDIWVTMLSTKLVGTGLLFNDSLEFRLNAGGFRVIDESLLQGPCHLDLNDGYNGNHIEREPPGMRTIEKSLIAKSPAGVLLEAVDHSQIVSRRGLLTSIALSNYLGHSGNLTFTCEKVKGVIFFNECAKSLPASTERNLFWGHRFEEYVVSSPDLQVEKEKVDEPRYNKFTTFTRLLINAELSDRQLFGKIKLFYHGEIDAVDRNGTYVQIKTCRGDHSRTVEMRNTYLRWYIQNQLTGVKKLFVGNRDKRGIVRNCEMIWVGELKRYLKGAEDECFVFLHHVLHGLVQRLQNGNYCVVKICGGVPSYETPADHRSFFSEEFKKHFHL